MGKLPGKKELITTNDFIPKFFDQLSHGQILGFKDSDGNTNHWRVCKLWKSKHQAMLEPWELYDTPEAANEARNA